MDVYRERIKPLFDASGLSVQEIADATGIKAKTIYNWNQGLSKSYTKFIPQIASFLNVTADYLSGTGNNKKAAPGGGVVERYSEIIRSLCGDDQEKLKLLQDALAKNPEKTKASFDLFLKTL